MSLPPVPFEICVNSWAICWWWPHFFGSFSFLQIKSGQTFWTKYKKLSWQSLICSIYNFSTRSLNWSVVKNSVLRLICLYTLYVYSPGCKGRPVRYIQWKKGGRIAKSPCRFCRAIGTSIDMDYVSSLFSLMELIYSMMVYIFVTIYVHTNVSFYNLSRIEF